MLHKSIITALLISIILPIIGFSQTKLDTISVFDGKLSMLSSKELKPMSDQMWALKYRSMKRPDLVLTDDNGEVNLIVNNTQQQATESQLLQFKDMQLQQLKKNRSDIDVLNSGIKTVNGKKVVYYKFVSQAIDQNVFNYSFFTIVDGKLVQFTFNCIQKMQEQWEKTVDNIVASLKAK